VKIRGVGVQMLVKTVDYVGEEVDDARQEKKRVARLEKKKAALEMGDLFLIKAGRSLLAGQSAGRRCGTVH